MVTSIGNGGVSVVVDASRVGQEVDRVNTMAPRWRRVGREWGRRVGVAYAEMVRARSESVNGWSVVVECEAWETVDSISVRSLPPFIRVSPWCLA